MPYRVIVAVVLLPGALPGQAATALLDVPTACIAPTRLNADEMLRLARLASR